MLLSVRDLSRQFDAAPVFSGVTFDVRAGERVGLVGPNGTGKTTLLNILSGIDHADTGSVDTPASADVALLEQHAEFPADRTLVAEARRGLAHLYELQDESARLAAAMAAASDPVEQDRLHKRFDQIHHELDHKGAYNIDHRVDEVLHGLGFEPDEYHRPLSTFSGGQQNRVLLARLLLRAPDVMLLDEPTNHLDIAATEWLEDWLSKCRQAVILVSHDRFFLDRVTTRIFEMHSGRLNDYRGNFSHYWRQRGERAKLLDRTYEKQQDFIAKTQDFIARNKYGQKHAQAADRVKKLERLDRVDKLDDFDELHMTFGEADRTGDWVIDAVQLAKGYGEPLFEDLTLRINRGDRIGILGPNGSGKTTLLRVLLGEIEPDAGTLRHGTGVKIGYFDQQLAGVDPRLDAVEAIRPPEFPDMTPGTLRSLLARFGLTGDMVFQPVNTMSGGERSRVSLAKIAARSVNVLVLDEPTNHLDLWSRDALERALAAFDGTLLFVSHDRYFLNRVAKHVIVLGGDRWRFYEGNYSDFVEFERNREPESDQVSAVLPLATPRPAPAEAQPEPRGRRRFPYRKVAEIEVEIAEHEELLERLQASLSDPDTHRDGQLVRDTTEAYEETQQRLEELYEHWEEAVELN